MVFMIRKHALVRKKIDGSFNPFLLPKGWDNNLYIKYSNKAWLHDNTSFFTVDSYFETLKAFYIYREEIQGIQVVSLLLQRYDLHQNIPFRDYQTTYMLVW